MMDDMRQSYTELSDSKVANLLKQMDKLDPQHGFHSKHSKMIERPFGFAPGWSELIVEDYSSIPFKSKSYLKNNKGLRPIIYSQDPYKDNGFDDLPLFLNHDTVAEYIDFYVKCLVIQIGKLKPVRHFDDIEWQDDLPPQARQSIEKDLLSYPNIVGDDDSLTVKMPCVYKQSILIVTFLVHSDGTVDILDRRSLIEDLPIRNFA
jgi:hypothetical protein